MARIFSVYYITRIPGPSGRVSSGSATLVSLHFVHWCLLSFAIFHRFCCQFCCQLFPGDRRLMASREQKHKDEKGALIR